MKRIDIRFRNIQSHYDTSFYFKEGLNFILADDNNVGKSTIFKLLTVISRMPNVNNDSLLELLRVNEDNGYALFIYDNEKVIFWMFRQDKVIKSFFEIIHDDGSKTRSLECPKSLLDALDIIKGKDGLPINFNDADSVQLIVEPSIKSDEIMHKILVDDTVENIKVNSNSLFKQIVQDFKVTKARYEENVNTLESLHYNMSVDNFNSELEELECYSRVLDAFDREFNSQNVREEINLECLGDIELYSKVLEVISAFNIDDIPKLDVNLEDYTLYESIFKLCKGLYYVDYTKFSISKIYKIDSERLNVLLNLLTCLEDVNIKTLFLKEHITIENIKNMSIALDVLDNLDVVIEYFLNLSDSKECMRILENEYKEIVDELSNIYQIIDCPVKGSVYYSEQKCIPTGD